MDRRVNARPRVFVRVGSPGAFDAAVSSVPLQVRAHVEFVCLHSPGQITRCRHPMVWVTSTAHQHPLAAEFDAAQAESMATSWSWPPLPLSDVSTPAG